MDGTAADGSALPLPATKTLRTGQYKTTPVTDSYKFGKTLGKGNFATVYIVTCLKDESKWACKVIDKAALGDDDREALQIEVDTMTKVSHDNIIRLREVYDSENHFNMILELCSGGELFDRIVMFECYTENQAQEAFAQMTEAVGHCHRLDIVHRDLKPENLIYRGELPDMCLKLADFGLAQIVSPSNTLKSACGTPGYVAPEILKGMHYGKPVDIWSLGVILYILLCGFPPFYEEHTPDLFKVIKAGEYDFPEPYWDDVSELAKDLIKKLLVVDPKDRYDARQILDHPWMAESASDDPKMSKQLPHFQGNLRKYNARRKFKGVIHGVMVANIMRQFTKKTKAKVARAKAERARNAPESSADEGGMHASIGATISGDLSSLGVMLNTTLPTSNLPDRIPKDKAKELAPPGKFHENKFEGLKGDDMCISKSEFFLMCVPTRKEAEAEAAADAKAALDSGVEWQKVQSCVRWNKPLSEIKATCTTAAHCNSVDAKNGNYPIRK